MGTGRLGRGAKPPGPASGCEAGSPALELWPKVVTKPKNNAPSAPRVGPARQRRSHVPSRPARTTESAGLGRVNRMSTGLKVGRVLAATLVRWVRSTG